MVSQASGTRRGLPLTLRLVAALTVASLFVAILVAFLGAERDNQGRAADQAVDRAEFATALCERLAPMLDRDDLLRMSVLTTAARDLTGGRVLVLDRTGTVRVDTAMVLGERRLGLLSHSGVIQRNIDSEGEGQRFETLAPVRFGGEVIGEVRLQHNLASAPEAFAWGLFGTVFLCCLSLVAVAAMMSHHWWARVRSATSSLIHIAAGEVGRTTTDAAPGELQELSLALAELDRGLHEGLNRVADAYVELAQQVVEGLERRRLVPPGHGERTARYAQVLASRLQLLPQDVRDLEMACRLHDLGKTWVRPSSLQKTDGLDQAERESLRQHPVRGADILQRMPELKRVSQFVRYQCEHYDGSGYPNGLRGERIPLGARILAIAAAYDLLTVCAIDGCQLTQDAALEQLAQDRGTLFDPWLLDLFAEEVRKIPDEGGQPILISTAGAVPYKAADAPMSEDGEDDDLRFQREIAGDVEVMFDEPAEGQP